MINLETNAQDQQYYKYGTREEKLYTAVENLTCREDERGQQEKERYITKNTNVE